MEIWRNYPLGNKVDLVERLLERGVLSDGERGDDVRKITRNRQPGRCCVEGCQVPAVPVVVPLPQIGSAPARSKPQLRKTGTEN